MNSVIDNINDRRSVRSFEDKAIPEEILETIINAGNMAPTGMNAQPWRFVVITELETRKKLADLALPRYEKWLEKSSPAVKERRSRVDAVSSDPVYYNAPAVVFVIGQPTMTSDHDCPMACENMMLAARSLGIGSCWVFFGQLVLDDPQVRKMLELKEGEKVYGPIVLGYPKGGFPPSPPKREADIKWV